MAYIVCTSNLDLVSFLFVPALYSTLKLEIFPFTCISALDIITLYKWELIVLTTMLGGVSFDSTLATVTTNT